MGATLNKKNQGIKRPAFAPVLPVCEKDSCNMDGGANTILSSRNAHQSYGLGLYGKVMGVISLESDLQMSEQRS